ncbi:hypothetical protein HOD38_04135 [archaeon]|jgi:beta propeller repeat protein|nr:hypothetical protein [archaeon]MBT4397430.1 hypothetical protein [archaeon]MBT4440502.1 hypothetical protein [archaeon]
MQKRGSVFWDVLPLVLILAVAIGSLSNVDFTGMVVSCNDLDSDSYYECTGCDDVTEFPSLPSGTKSGLDIARDKIIYTMNDKIYVYDIGDDVNTQVSTATLAATPSIYSGTDAVWISKEGMVKSITLWNDVDYASNMIFKFHPKISSTYIVYQALNFQEGTGTDIVVMPRSTMVAQASKTAGSQSFPSVYENSLVYQDDGNGDYNIIYVADLADVNSKQTIASGLGDQLFPKIYGDLVVWQDDSQADSNVRGYDIATSSIISIAVESGVDERYPDVYGNYIVWSDNRDGYYNVYLYDYSTSTEYAVTSGANNNLNPIIGSDYIVWLTDDSDISGIALSEVLADGEMCSNIDCDDTNASINPLATEVCDGVDNNCDGVVDEDCDATCVDDADCVGGTCVAGECVLDAMESTCVAGSLDWLDDTMVSITEMNSDEAVYMYGEGDGTCGTKILNFTAYEQVYDETTGTYYQGDMVVTIDATDLADDEFYGYIELDDYGLDDSYYNFVLTDGDGSLESTNLKVCADTTNCTFDSDINLSEYDDELDLPDAVSCLYEGIDYNFFLDDLGEPVNCLAYGSGTYLFGLNDGSCADVIFYLYGVTDNGDGTYSTGSLVETFYPEIVEDEGLYGAMDYWTVLTEGYYYYIVISGTSGTYSDSLYVSASDPCSEGAITVSDSADIIASYTSTATDTTTDTTADEEEEETGCAAQWDCTGVEWDECDLLTGTKVRDITLCIMPTDLECLEDYSSWPAETESCISVPETDAIDEVRDTAEVPIFTWLNWFMVVFVLTGYYFIRK